MSGANIAHLSLVHNSKQLSLMDSALSYADRGWCVFPITPKQKAPALFKAWNKQATNNKVQVEKWWSRWPDANIGIVTGELSGIFVLDIDPKNGGDESITKLLQDQNIPDTLTVRTGSGGSHIFFNYPTVPIKTRANFPDKGLDIRSNGGYVVAAGSIHPNGNTYQWANNYPVNDAPEWLIKLLTTKKAPIDLKSNIPVGARNSELFRRGLALRGEGASTKQLGIELHKINTYQCEMPLDDDEVNGIVTSVNNYLSEKPPLFKYRDYIRSPEFPKDATLRHVAHAITFYMDVDGNNGYPTEEQIAADTGYTRETVSKKVKMLSELKLLHVKKHKADKQKYANNLYLLPKKFMKPRDSQRGSPA